MDKLRITSPDLTAGNIDKLAELFPSVITETVDAEGKTNRGVDFDLLRQELSDHVVEGPQERYRLDWPGKRAASFAANAPIAKTLRPVREESVDFDTTKNLFIEGDNLEALKLLQESYLGKVKLIYIDPPYNTGRDFIYNDNFTMASSDYDLKSQEKDSSGRKLVVNTTANGRYHSDWLSMMLPRIKLAKSLLSEDGLIAVSIDDHEISRLRDLLDELYGSENFIATVIWHKMDSPKNSARHLSEDHEYLVLYARNADIWRPKLLPRSDDMIARYKNPDGDPRGPWLLGDLAARNVYDQGVYEITTPSGRFISGPPAGSYWRVSKRRFEELDADGRIWWGDGSVRPGIKRFLSEVRDGVIPQTYWNWKDVGSTRNAKRYLHQLMGAKSGDNLFVTPKPVGLLERIISISTERDSLILDFFAGSGTMGEAVVRSNISDGGKRNYILVQMKEDYPEGSGYESVSDFARARLRCVGSSLSDGLVDVDSGYRSLHVDTTNMADVSCTPEETDQLMFDQLEASIKPGRTSEDLLFQVLLDWGVELSLSIDKEDVAGHELLTVEDGALIACFDQEVSPNIVREIARREPLRAVFRDDGFEDDAARINAEQIFREVSPKTDIKAI